MNNIILYLISILAPVSAFAATLPVTDGLPPKLVKISKDSDPKCVEYVSYKGEIYCSLTPIDEKPVNLKDLSYERQKIQFDNRPWKASWAKHTNTISTIEYVPLGESINQWNELITSQFIPVPPQVSPQQFHQYILNDMTKSGITYTTRILDEQPNMLIFEFQVSKPINLQQDEIQKIVKATGGFYILHYVIKKEDMGEVTRRLWLNNLIKSALIR